MVKGNMWLFLSVIILAFLKPSIADAFILPQNSNIGPGSEWVYSSNLGIARSKILSRERIGSHWEFRWQLAVAGLTYEESLWLTDDMLSVMDRVFTAFHIYRDSFSFPENELTLRIPLVIGSSWVWDGPVVHGNKTGLAQVRGRVMQETTVSVPAGDFKVFEIELKRTDDFGTEQVIKIWFHTEIGVVKATAQLKWQGFVGKMQQLVGFNDFTVELRSYEIVAPK